MSKEKYSVLFVCMGNICRSPTAEGVFRKLVADAGLSAQIVSDSAGTHAYHEGSPPDKRALEAAARRGYELHELRARPVNAEDFEQHDYILAMDRDNLEILWTQAAEADRDKIRLFLDFANPGGNDEVPDPYYGGTSGFERVLDLVEEASRGLLETLRTRLEKS